MRTLNICKHSSTVYNFTHPSPSRSPLSSNSLTWTSDTFPLLFIISRNSESDTFPSPFLSKPKCFHLYKVASLVQIISTSESCKKELSVVGQIIGHLDNFLRVYSCEQYCCLHGLLQVNETFNIKFNDWFVTCRNGFLIAISAIGLTTATLGNISLLTFSEIKLKRGVWPIFIFHIQN